MAELTYHDVARLLKADFETGKLFWLPRPLEMFKDGKQSAEHNCAIWNSRFPGTEAFTAVNGWGYRHGRIFGRAYRAHRVIWLLATKEWPADEIDHINGVKDDNRMTNLRQVTGAENRKNTRLSKANTSGIIGVSWLNSRRKWAAQIHINGRSTNLGHFLEKSDAIAARKAAEIKYGYHPNHGRR